MTDADNSDQRFPYQQREDNLKASLDAATAEINEWRVNALTQQARIEELEAKNVRLVQMRADEAADFSDRLRMAAAQVSHQARLCGNLETQIAAHTSAVGMINGRAYNAAQMGRIIKSRERAHKRVRILLESQKAAHSRIGGILKEQQAQPASELTQQVRVLTEKYDGAMKECERLVEQVHQVTMKNRALAEESESMERDMRDMHARMVRQEPYVMAPNRRLVITLDYVPISPATRMLPTVGKALLEFIESGHDGVQFEASNGVTLTFNAWPSVTEEELQERKLVDAAAVQEHETKVRQDAAAWAQAEEERHQAASMPAAAISEPLNEIPELNQPMVMIDPSVVEGILGRLTRLEAHANGVSERLDTHSRIAVATGEAVQAISNKVK